MEMEIFADTIACCHYTPGPLLLLWRWKIIAALLSNLSPSFCIIFSYISFPLWWHKCDQRTAAAFLYRRSNYLLWREWSWKYCQAGGTDTFFSSSRGNHSSGNCIASRRLWCCVWPSIRTFENVFNSRSFYARVHSQIENCLLVRFPELCVLWPTWHFFH